MLDVRLISAVSSVLLLGACVQGPSTKDDLCVSFGELNQQLWQGNGLFGNLLFRKADSLGDMADRYEAADLSRDARDLHAIGDSSSVSVDELMNATQGIANICGHTLGTNP